MLEALPFTHHSQLCCDCIAVQAHADRTVAVGSYELLSSTTVSGSDPTISDSSKVGVGGQMRTGAIDFFEVDGDALHLLHHLPCAAGIVLSLHPFYRISPAPSVFDIEWSTSADACLAASSADGSVLLISGGSAWAQPRTVEIAVEHGCMASGVSWHADSLSLCCSLTRCCKRTPHFNCCLNRPPQWFRRCCRSPVASGSHLHQRGARCRGVVLRLAGQ
jgi:hypothetical protein